MAMYTNTLTKNEKLWLELNITQNEELKTLMGCAREDNRQFGLQIYSDEDGVFVSLTTSDQPNEVTDILKKCKNVKQVRQALIDHIQETLQGENTMTNTITINGKTFANNFELLEDVLNYVTKGNDETTAINEWAEQEGYDLLAFTISVSIKDKTPLTVDDDFTMALVKDMRPDLLALDMPFEEMAKQIAFDIADLTGNYFE